MCNLVQRDVKMQNKYIISKNIEKTKIFLKNNSILFLILRMFWYKISLNERKKLIVNEDMKSA
jgi:hypothetical protein